ncbi:MAG: type II toxin-antitoxin system prevent-host-death family antitoxin [bacterium]|nr:type II toxin-antitoxin system prevent-host-death family antitoxin [bacterium]
MNDSISYSQLRQTLKDCLDKVCSEHHPLLVKRKNGEDVVILSKEDYTSLEETIYLLRSPKNVRRLQESLESQKTISFKNAEDLKNELGL